MVVLSTGMEPNPDTPEVARVFGISLSPDGFFLEKHPKLGQWRLLPMVSTWLERAKAPRISR